MVRFAPDALPRLGEIRVDAIAIAFNFGVAIVTAVAFGAMPIVRRTGLARGQRSLAGSEVARGVRGPRGHLMRHVLMGAQVALALVLLVASALLVRSFEALRRVDPAFDPRSALTFRIGLPPHDYPGQPGISATNQAILDRVAALPGVTRAAASTCMPLADDAGGRFTSQARVYGRVLPPGTLSPATGFCAVSASYFETMGTPVVRGRGIEADDVSRRRPVAVINQAAASAYFGDADPIGQRVSIGPPRNTAWLEIVGIVRNMPTRALSEATPMPHVFLPMTVSRAEGLPVAPDVGAMFFIVRAATDAASQLAPVRGAVKAVDGNLALSQVRTLQDLLDRSAAQAAFTMALLAIAAGVALILGVVGIYGVTSYIVAQRTSEIGVRLALGAAPRDVAAMIVRQGSSVAAAGTVAGLAGAAAVGRAMSSLLYGVSPHDPAVFAAVTVGVLCVAVAACWLPARRAARLNPLEALRAE